MRFFPDKLIREDDGTWHWMPRNKFIEYFQDEKSFYQTQIIKIINILDPIFENAKTTCESEFAKMLLRFRGMHSFTYDPYQVSVRTIESLQLLFGKTKEEPLRTSLALYSYAHILESSWPLEMIASCLSIIDGGTYIIFSQFPPIGTRTPSPGERIRMLIPRAQNVGIYSLDDFEKEIGWDRNLRNGIFHSDYGLSRNEIIVEQNVYTREKFGELINRAMAYFDAIKYLYRYHVMSYEEPKILTIHPTLVGDPEQRFVTMIRKGYGLIAIQSAWTVEQEKRGKIRMRIAQGFTKRELELLKQDPSRAIYPADKNVTWP